MNTSAQECGILHYNNEQKLENYRKDAGEKLETTNPIVVALMSGSRITLANVKIETEL